MFALTGGFRDGGMFQLLVLRESCLSDTSKRSDLQQLQTLRCGLVCTYVMRSRYGRLRLRTWSRLTLRDGRQTFSNLTWPSWKRRELTSRWFGSSHSSTPSCWDTSLTGTLLTRRIGRRSTEPRDGSRPLRSLTVGPKVSGPMSKRRIALRSASHHSQSYRIESLHLCGRK